MHSFSDFCIWTIIWIGVPSIPLWYILHKFVLWREESSKSFEYEKYTIGQCLLSIIVALIPIVNLCSALIAFIFLMQSFFSNNAKWTVKISLIVKFVKFLKKEI